MRTFVILIVAWTLFDLAILLFWPVNMATGGCWRLVSHSTACDAQLVTLNDELWKAWTLPLLVVLASGYVAIGVMAAVSLGRLARRRIGRAPAR